MPENTSRPGFFSSLRFRYGSALLVFLTIAGYFLWAEHKAHILGYLPLVLFLGLCVGMHSFMHGGHGDHDGKQNDGEK